MNLDEQIKALKPLDRIRIKIKDTSTVRPEARGKTVECNFLERENNSHEGLIVWCEGEEEAISLLEHEDVPYKITKLGFHEWLIESLEVIKEGE
jgi:hypothetical protein